MAGPLGGGGVGQPGCDLRLVLRDCLGGLFLLLGHPFLQLRDAILGTGRWLRSRLAVRVQDEGQGDHTARQDKGSGSTAHLPSDSSLEEETWLWLVLPGVTPLLRFGQKRRGREPDAITLLPRNLRRSTCSLAAPVSLAALLLLSPE
jgi:hypothetical protein